MPAAALGEALMARVEEALPVLPMALVCEALAAGPATWRASRRISTPGPTTGATPAMRSTTAPARRGRPRWSRCGCWKSAARAPVGRSALLPTAWGPLISYYARTLPVQKPAEI